MTDQYSLAGSPYQPKSADERAGIMQSSADPVSTALDEITAMLHDGSVKKWLYEQDSVPVTMLLPWLQELYGKGVADGKLIQQTAIDNQGVLE